MTRSKRVPLARLLVEEAQLHGVKRLADKKFRFFWAVALVLLMWSATSILLMHIARFLDHPTSVTRSEYFRNQMNFPSVLLYPELYYPDYKIDTLLGKMNFPPEMNRTYIKSVIRQLATFYNSDILYNVDDLENIERFLDYNQMSLNEATEAMTTTCEEALLRYGLDKQ